jgi:hypothetical protein
MERLLDGTSTRNPACFSSFLQDKKIPLNTEGETKYVPLRDVFVRCVRKSPFTDSTFNTVLRTDRVDTSHKTNKIEARNYYVIVNQSE